ncbi:MAG: 50S ribosomal protein L25/general stress protein Ctc [Coxiella-like endosymbiont]
MVAESLELMVALRKSTGKSAMRRMRQFDDKVPGTVYGAGKAPQSISLLQKDILKALKNEAVLSSILTIKISDKKQKVVIKDLQRHHTKPKILHIDFQRIKATEKLTMNIPLHFIGEDECPGVEQGGVISHLQTEVEVRCLPAALPEYIEVDLSRLELDKSFHLSDLKLPAGVELTITPDEQHDLPIVSVHIHRVSQADIEAQQTGVVEKSAESRETKTEINTNERE